MAEDEDITVADAEASLLRSTDDGVLRFSDGTNDATEHSLESRIKALQYLKQSEASATPFGVLSHVRLRSQGGGF